MRRAQSHVVGVALMLGVTVLALGALTVGIGSVFEAQTASADADRVADDLDATLQPVERTGPHVGRVAFSDGRLTTAEREIRVLRDGRVVSTVEVDALVFSSGDQRVTFLGGAITRTQGPGTWLVRDPPIAATRGDGVLAVSAPKLNGTHQTVAGSGHARLRTNVSHDRSALGEGSFAVAIETERPAAFETHFQEPTVATSRQDLDGDGIESVVAEYPGTRRGYLVVHDMRLEVS